METPQAPQKPSVLVPSASPTATVKPKSVTFRSLVFKTSFFVSLLMFISLIIISVVFVFSEKQKVTADIVKNGKIFSSFSTKKIYDDYVQYYTHPDETDFQNFKKLTQETLKNNTDVVGVSLISFNGKILFDSAEFTNGKASGPRDVTDTNLLEMIKSESTTSVSTKFNGVGEATEIVVPLPEISGSHILSMRYLISNRSLNERMNQVYFQIALTIIPILIIVIFLAIPYSIALTKPMIDLTKVAQKIQSGDLSVQAEIRSNDELGVLGAAFNGMVIGLSDKIKELKNANDEINKGWLQIQQEKAKLAASIENMPVGFLMTDILGNILVTNTLAHKNLGATSDNEAYEIVKKILAGKVDLNKYLHECNETSKTLVYGDISLTDGRFLKVFVSPILTQDETDKRKCTGVVVLVDDITEVKILERSKDEFFSIASHELRTPLTAIRGNTSMIKELYMEKLKDPELSGMINDIHDSAIRLIDIVNDFLNVSRLEMGKIEFKKSTFDLVPLVSQVINELTTQIGGKKIVLKIGSAETKSLSLVSDPDRVKEILINLVGNAIKYTENGEILVEYVQIDGFTKVSVRDTGNGISAENQKLLFHKFQQAGASLLTRDTTRSTGLGLYICKLIVEGLGGKIWLESSAENKGSVFSFTLPN